MSAGPVIRTWWREHRERLHYTWEKKNQTEQKQHAVQSEQTEKESRSAEGKLSDWWGPTAATGNQPQSEVLISRSQQVYLHDVQSFLIAADEDAGRGGQRQRGGQGDGLLRQAAGPSRAVGVVGVLHLRHVVVVHLEHHLPILVL